MCAGLVGHEVCAYDVEKRIHDGQDMIERRDDVEDKSVSERFTGE